MKKVIMGIIIGAIGMLGITTFADTVNVFTAQKATFDVYVNGQKFVSDKPTVAIDGSTYLPLKATGEVLGVEVNWNSEERRVEIGEMENEKQMASPDGIPLENQMASPDGIPLETVPSIVTPTITPTKTVPSLTPSVNERFGSNLKTYRYQSDIIKTDSRVQYALVTYQGEQYIELNALSAIVTRDGEDYYVQLPGKDLVLVQTNMSTTKDSYFYMGSTFVKLSSVGLKARIEGDTAYIEWAD